MSLLRYELSDEYDDISFLHLPGDFNAASMEELTGVMQSLFAAGRPFVVVDLAEAESLRGAVIGELMEWRRKFIAEIDGEFCFCGASQSVEREIRELDVDKLFRLFPDRRSAVNYFFWEFKGQVDTVILSIPGSLDLVPATRKFIRKVCEAKAYSGRESFQIETIVDELCNNAIEHGASGGGKSIELAVAVGRKKVDINISNGVDVGERNYSDIVSNMERYVESPNTDVCESRGRGLALVKMLSSEFDIDGSENGTCVHVTKIREER
ncbi:ATP-binding protein [Chitinivibrio alkaliphilus]|uniref:Anti-sigma regulatory factor, serine/threonine protein kinase n=1 Tax=Chitinivibrio alkaliphilus ACht1 TaxID=1313304 RepID=U7D733_9BACT|nr:ATP-binding protein [Chitinivibrio alkaliphilus]ERP31361.1 anti-sigma regulatory factor, serine/threonine protein kinase [Chitinivibrio alkaliphilus ACht1]